MTDQHSRFDYIAYDERAAAVQSVFKTDCKMMEFRIQSLSPGRAQALALTALEECYMWIGKSIRDDQIERTGKCPLMEARFKS